MGYEIKQDCTISFLKLCVFFRCFYLNISYC